MKLLKILSYLLNYLSSANALPQTELFRLHPKRSQHMLIYLNLVLIMQGRLFLGHIVERILLDDVVVEVEVKVQLRYVALVYQMLETNSLV